jgi:hypothetical protein
MGFFHKRFVDIKVAERPNTLHQQQVDSIKQRRAGLTAIHQG